MKLSVSNAGVCRKTLKIEVAADAVAATRAQVLQDLQRVAQVPGFRVGRAPQDLVVRHYGAKAREETVRRVVAEYLPKALAQSKLDLLSDPEVTEVSLDDGRPLAFTAHCEIMPDIALRPFRGVKLTRPAVAVTDAQVAEVVARLQARHAELAPVVEPRPLAAGDFAVVDFTCTVGGAVVESRTGVTLELTPEADRTGLSQALLGRAPSDDPVTVETTLPADVPAKAHAGKPATFVVTVKAIKTRQTPPLDDAFAKLVGVETLEALRARVRDDLTRELTAQAHRAVEEQAIQKLLDQTSFEVPPSLVQSQAERLLRESQWRLLSQGTAPDEVESRKTLLTESSKQGALRQVKTFFLLRQVAKAQGLAATEAEVESRIAAIAAQSSRTPEQVRAELQRERLLSELVWDVTRGKALAWLLAQAQIEEKTA